MSDFYELDTEQLDAVSGGDVSLTTLAHAIIDGVNAGLGALGGSSGGAGSGSGGGSGSGVQNWHGPIPRLPAL